MNTQVEHFFRTAQQWKEEFNLLREIVSDNKSLKEDYKWMHPCYTLEGKNIVLIHGFKGYCALLFHKGVLINDKKGFLIQQTENVQSARQMRFTDIDQIATLKPVIEEYIREAIRLEQSGKKVKMKTVSEYSVPAEFKKALNEDKALKKAFYSLTPGRQKGYLFHFNQARQSATREARIEKVYQRILDGRGIKD